MKSVASGAAIDRTMPRLRAACLIIGVLLLFQACTQADEVSSSRSSPSLLNGRWSQLAQPLFRDFAPIASQYPQVYAMALDGDGFLWLGSRRGLARWDGYRMHTYVANPKDPRAIQDAYVTVLYSEPAGHIWVGTSAGGLSRYDRGSDTFTTYSAGPNGLTHSSIYSIVGDGAGGLWIATGAGEGSGGLDHLDPSTGHFTHTFHEDGVSTSLPDNAVRALLLDKSETLWVGTLKGLAKRAKGASDFVFIPLPAASSASVPRVFSLYQSTDGTIWIGTSSDGVFFIRPGTTQAQMLSSAASSTRPEISALAIDFTEPTPGELWIATAGEGIVVVDTSSLKTRHLRHDRGVSTSVADDFVVKLFSDRSGLVWVGAGDRLQIYNPQSAIVQVSERNAQSAGLSENWATTLFAAPDGRIWAGLAKSGIDIIDPSANRIVKNISADKFRAKTVYEIVAAPEGNVFAGTEAGLYRLDLSGDHIDHFVLQPRRAFAAVPALAMDDNLLWLGTADGIWNLESQNGPAAAATREPLSDQLTDQYETVMWRTSSEMLWIGTGKGLNRFDLTHRTMTQFLPGTRTGVLSGPYVSELLFDGQHRLWVGSSGGIDLLEEPDRSDPGPFRHVDVSVDGLPLGILSLLEAPDHSIWASTTDGVAIVDPQTLSVRLLRRAEGVANQFLFDSSRCQTTEGELLFGGTNGITVARPNQLTSWDFRPPIVVVDAKAGDKPVLASQFNSGSSVSHDQFTISPDANSLSIEFAALDYSAPERNRYAHRLEGYDPTWTESDATRRVATYTNLPPGDYLLRLRGTNRDGVWSNAELSIPIHVLAPWYRTWLAYAAYLLMFSTALWFAFWWRLRRMQQATRVLEKTVAERTMALANANAALETAKQDAESATRAKSEFLASMSHEIRTPMNAVLGFARLGLNHDLPPKTLDYFRKINNAGQSLLGILNDILDFSKVEAGKLTLESIPFRLSDVLAQVVDLFSLKATEQGLDFAVTTEEGLPNGLVGDPLRLSQVLVNLIGNALKFTNRGYVRLVVRAAANDELPNDEIGLHFAIEDSGIGMTKEQVSKLFIPFSQADSSTTRQYGGTGLGLTISQRLVTQMGGKIEVASVPGSGSQFSFTAKFLRSNQSSPAKSEFASVSNIETDESHEKKGQPAPTPTLAGARILLAEDNPINQQLAVEILGNAGALVDVADNGIAAVRRVDETSYDVVLMDIQMPGLDGYMATDQIRRTSRHASVPIIAMTAYASGVYRTECLSAGMNDFVTKPINPDVLLSVIKKWLRSDRGKSECAPNEQDRVEANVHRPTFDLQSVLHRVGGKELLLRRLLDMFIAEYGNAAKEIEDAVQRSDWPTAARLVHTIKGSAGNLSAIALYGISESLEENIKNRDKALSMSTLKKFEAALEAFLAAAKVYCSDSAPR